MPVPRLNESEFSKHRKEVQVIQRCSEAVNAGILPITIKLNSKLAAMHTVWVRLNAVVFFGLTVLLGLSCLAAISKIGHSYQTKPIVEKLELNRLKSLKSHGGVDRALLSFDLKVDLAPAFHWNIKQLFVYVVAQYETKGRINQVVLWDKIVEAASPKMVDESNIFVKYALVDQGAELRGKNVKLQLQWDHMPITGFLHMDWQSMETTSSFDLPNEYQ